jgi:hypothetical protein
MEEAPTPDGPGEALLPVQAYVLSVCKFLSTQYVKELLPDKWDCSTDNSSAGISRLLVAMQFEYVRE